MDACCHGGARLLNDPPTFSALTRTIAELSARGIAAAHQYANYTVAALHDVGLASVTHQLWMGGQGRTDDRAGLCDAFVPDVCARRTAVRSLSEAKRLSGDLTLDKYAERYCECAPCRGMLHAGQQPFNLLLETQTVPLSNGQERQTPASRSVGANTWHFLTSRRNEGARLRDPPCDRGHRAEHSAGGSPQAQWRCRSSRLPGDRVEGCVAQMCPCDFGRPAPLTLKLSGPSVVGFDLRQCYLAGALSR